MIENNHVFPNEIVVLCVYCTDTSAELKKHM